MTACCGVAFDDAGDIFLKSAEHGALIGMAVAEF
jgi:hypothetical protein